MGGGSHTLLDPGGIGGGRHTLYDPGGVYGKKDRIYRTDDKLAGVQLQTSTYGSPLPLVYGTARVPGQLIDYDDFLAVPHTTQSEQAGKGGGPGPTVSTSWTYTCGVILALCEGPITLINQVWRDKEIGSMAGYSLTLITGTNPQSPWSTWAAKHPTKAVGYAGFALACGAAVDLGTSGALKNNSFEVKALLATQQDGSSAAYDAKPADILPDLLTHPQHGAGWNAAQVGDLTTGASSWATYCQATGIVLSPAWMDQRPCRDLVRELMEATNSVPLWSVGPAGSMLLKVIPYGDQPITANGATFIPNTTPYYDFTYDDFLGVVGPDGTATGADAVTVTRSSTQEVFNCVPVEFCDRSQGYNNSVVDDPDPVDVALNGLKKDSPKSLPCVKKASVALQISRIAAQRNVYVRNTYSWKAGWRHMLLEPMDLVTLTDPKLGLDHKVVRIKSIEIPDESSEVEGLTFVAEEWPFGTGTATLYTTQTPGGTSPNVNADPGNANAPVVFDVPALYRQGADPEIMLGTSGGDIWGGCEIWVSTDNATYAKVGQITAPARHGVLTANMAAGSAVLDTTSTCAVDLTASKGVLQTVAAQVATDLQSLCWCDGEFFSYQTATLTAANKYTLQTLLVRGAYGTPQASHLSGKSFVRVDSALARVSLPVARIGQTIYIKLVSFNIWGGGKQDISAVSPITFVPSLQNCPQPYNVTIAVSDARPA